jgi:hypothetical protein
MERLRRRGSQGRKTRGGLLCEHQGGATDTSVHNSCASKAITAYSKRKSKIRSVVWPREYRFSIGMDERESTYTHYWAHHSPSLSVLCL